MNTEDRTLEAARQAVLSNIAHRLGNHQFGDALALLRAHEDAVRAEAGEDIAHWQRRAEAAELGKREADGGVERLLGMLHRAEEANGRIVVEQCESHMKIQALEAVVVQFKARNETLDKALRHAKEWLDEEGCDCDTGDTCAFCITAAALGPVAEPAP